MIPRAERSATAAELIELLGAAVNEVARAPAHFARLASRIESLAPSDWPHLGPEIRLLIRDYGMRCSYEGFLEQAAHQRHEWPWAAWVIFTEHPSGYIRQRATAKIGDVALRHSLPHFLVRANDWVEPVRDEAVRALCRQLEAQSEADVARELAACIGILAWLRKATRHSQTDLLQLLAKHLATPTGESALIERVQHGNIADQRSVCSWLEWLDHETAPSEPMLAALFECDDVKARSFVARGLQQLEASRPEFARDLQSRLVNDPAPVLRSAGLHSILRTDPAPPTGLLRTLLCDPSASVRYAARYFLANRTLESNEQIADRYRSIVQTVTGDSNPDWHTEAFGSGPHDSRLPPPSPDDARARRLTVYAAIAGLAETGQVTDAERLRPLLTEPLETTAAQALGRRALAAAFRLDAPTWRPLVIAWLLCTELRAAALRCLDRRLCAEDGPTLVAAARAANEVPLTALHDAVDRLPTWPRVCAWLDLVANAPDIQVIGAPGDAATLGADSLAAWCADRHVRTKDPTRAEQAALEASWQAARDRLPDALRRDLLRLELPFGHARPFDAADRA